jgi:WD40 repeat protein
MSTHKRCFVFLHKGGYISYWDSETFEFVHSFRLNSPSTKIIFESSKRYIASLSVSGSVEVWSVKNEKHEWDLSFNSVSNILNNPSKENQFVITMNSADAKDAKPDSIILFQYSRPQNVIMYWKSQLPFLNVVYCE